MPVTGSFERLFGRGVYMRSKGLPFEGIKNARDLGGIVTKDGHVVRRGKLIKSGSICDATGNDLRILMDAYKLKVVVDLRTEMEREKMPDPCLLGVAQIWNPLFKSDTQGLGVFKADSSDILYNHLKSIFVVSSRNDEALEVAVQQVQDMIRKENFRPEEYMLRLYQKFINNQVVQKQVKQFFSLLTNNRGGAILWHCSAGKDRAGMLTALLLYALGVSKETIIEDYMASAESSEDAVEYILDRLFPGKDCQSICYREIAKQIFSVRACYIESFFEAIERDYVSIDNYLQKAIEIHVDNIVRLKTLYLE